MARKAMIEKEKKRRRIVAAFAERRKAINAKLKATDLSLEDRMELQGLILKMPRDASPCRLRNRCMITGRANGYYRYFGLGRNKLREHAMNGEIPGLVKSSW